MALVTLTLSALATLVPLYAARLGADAAAIGLLVALPNVFPIVFALLAGRLVDGLGATRWLVWGTAGMTLAPLVVAIAAGLPALALAQLLLGLFHLVATLASQSVVADLSAGRSFERTFSLYSTALAAGRTVGPLAAGAILDLAGFRTAFATMAAVSVLAALLTLVVRALTARALTEEGGEGAAAPASVPPQPDAGEPPPRQRSAVVAALANPGVQLAVLASSGVFVAISVRQAFLPVYLAELAYSASTIGAILSFGALVAVLVRLAMPALSHRLGGPARTLVLAMLAVALSTGALGAVDTLAPLLVLAFLNGLGTGIGLPLSLVTVASHVERSQRGLALGLRLSLNRAAQLAAPVAVGALLGVIGFAAGFVVAGVLLALLAVVAALRVPAFERAPGVGASRSAREQDVG
jgi:MFS family permease